MSSKTPVASKKEKTSLRQSGKSDVISIETAVCSDDC